MMTYTAIVRPMVQRAGVGLIPSRNTALVVVIVGVLGIVNCSFGWPGRSCELPQLCPFPAQALNSDAATDGLIEDRDLRLVTDGRGAWIAVWAALGILGGDQDVFFSRSVNSGQTWTAMAPLNTNAGVDSGNDSTPHVATDGTGFWIAVWRTQDSLGGTIGTEGDILCAVSADNGTTWSAPAVVNSNAASDSGIDAAPRVAVDGTGTWIVTWQSNDSLGGTTGTDRDILFARSVNSGATWTAPAALNTNAATDTGNDDSPYPVASESGTWVVAWPSLDSLNGTIGTDRDILFSRSVDGGMTWSAVEPLNTNAATDGAADDNTVVLATDEQDRWVAVWTCRPSSSDTDLRSATSTDDGSSWTDPSALNQHGAVDVDDDVFPSIATDGAGLWIVAWESDDPFDGALGTDTDIIMAASIDVGASWSREVRGNSTAAADGIIEDHKPTVATNGTVWTLAWTTSDTFQNTTGSDLDIAVAQLNLLEPGDCDRNGIGDTCDLADGTLMDADYNGVPDMCQPPPGPPPHLETVAITGDPSPTGGTHAVFSGAVMNGGPSVLFWMQPSAGPAALAQWDDNESVVLAQITQQAPGAGAGVVFATQTGLNFTSYVLGSAGDVSFASRLSGPGVSGTNDMGIWMASDDDLHYVMREGDQAAGTSAGTVFLEMPSTAGTPKPRINSNGVVVFAGRLTGPDVVSTNSGGIWKWSAGTQQLVARWGEVAPGTAETFKFCWDPHVDSLDRILVPARIASGSSPDGYWFGPSGSLSLVVTKGQQAPGMIAGVTFGTLDSNPLLASNGDIAFHVTLLGTGISTANDSSVWQWSNGTFTCLVQEGQAAPGLIAGTLFGTQAAISISPSGRVLFAGSLTGESLTSSNNSALWMETTSGVQMVAREGDQGPGATAGSVFSGFTASELQAAINVHDEIVFGLDVGFNPVAGVWGWTDWNGVFPIAPPGGALYANDALIGTIVEAFISSFDAAVNDSFSTTLNNDGQFAIKVNLASKTGFQGVFRGSMPVFGDINGDLHVNIQDLLLVIASWGPCPCDQPCNEDINESRIVNVSDLLLVIANWG